MIIHLVTLSPQGHITIPKQLRRQIQGNKFFLELRDDILVMKPCVVTFEQKNVFASKALIEAVIGLTVQQRRLYKIIRKHPCSVDFIYEKTKWGFGKISSRTRELEEKGVIRLNRCSLWEVVEFGESA